MGGVGREGKGRERDVMDRDPQFCACMQCAHIDTWPRVHAYAHRCTQIHTHDMSVQAHACYQSPYTRARALSLSLSHTHTLPGQLEPDSACKDGRTYALGT